MQKILVSVIIPVFNPGPGIDRCIRSVRNQTLQDIEILFIDDCSTEDYVPVALEAAAKDERVRVLTNEKNMGPGYSRNRGIQEARGEYLSFIDPDDYVATDFLELLYKAIKEDQADIAKGVTILEREDGSHVEIKPQTNRIISQRLSAGEPLYSVFTRGHQNTIYRKEFILSENIRYSLARRGEDVVFLLKVCLKTDKITLVDDAHYHYCLRSNSILHSKSASQLEAYFDSFSELAELCLNDLPKNKYTDVYLMDLFSGGIRELYRYMDDSNIKNEIEPYIALLRSEWESVPQHNDLAKENYPLYVLQEYGYLLPAKILDPWSAGNIHPVIQAKLLKHWIDFYSANPKEMKAMSGDLKKIISDTNKAVHSHYKYFASEEKKQGRTIYREQIKRLPLSLLMSSIMSSIMSRFKRKMARLYKKVLKGL